MANDFLEPSDLPDRVEGIAGQPLSSGLRRRLGRSQNWLHAAGPCGNVLSQSWAFSQCAWNGAVQAKDVCVWRIPAMPGHPTLNVRTLIESPFGGGTATLRLPHTADSFGFAAVGGAGLTWGEAPLAFNFPAAGYADLHLDLVAAGVIEVRNVAAAFAPLASPLAAGLADGGFDPWGEDAANVDRVAPSADGHQLIRNGRILIDYPRTFMCWSAVRGVQSYAGAASAPDTMPKYPHRSVVLPTPGTIRDGGVARIWLRVLADEIVTDNVIVHAGPLAAHINVNGDRWGDPVLTFAVDPIADPNPLNRIVWYEAEFTVPEGRWMRELPWHNVAVGLFPGDAGVRTTADILSCTIVGT